MLKGAEITRLPKEKLSLKNKHISVYFFIMLENIATFYV
jgi:hypothetical protein